MQKSAKSKTRISHAAASQTPFTFNFLTDAWTMATIATTVFRGFKLTYFETTC
jgi:hypothetical protein